MAIIDWEHVAADWAKRGSGCDLWIDSPGRRWEVLTHPTDELVLMLVGKMEFEIAGRARQPEVGEEILIPAGAVHSARNCGAITARWPYDCKE